MAIFLSTIPNLSTSIRVNGAIYRIKFIPRDKPYSNGLFAVSEQDVVNAIRRHPYFGNVITEMVEEGSTPVEIKKKEFSATYPEITKSQDAKEILVNKYKVNNDILINKATIKKAADELNIDFPNL